MAQELFRASPQQKRICSFQKGVRENLLCEIQAAFRPSMPIVELPDYICRRLKSIEILSTEVVSSSHGEFFQRINPELEIPMIVLGHKEFPGGQEDADSVRDELRQKVREGKARLVGLIIPKLEGDCALWLCASPLVADSTTLYLIFRMVSDEGSGTELDGCELQYADVAEWLLTLQKDKGSEFWKRRMLPLLETQLPVGRTGLFDWPDGFRSTGSMSAEITCSISGRAKYAMSWISVLARLYGSDNILLGWHSTGRLLKDLEGTYGNLSHVLPLETAIDWADSFDKGVVSLERSIVEIEVMHEFFSWDFLLESGQQTKNYLLCQLEYQEGRYMNWPDLHDHVSDLEPYFLKLSLRSDGDKLRMKVQYDEAAYDKDEIEELIGRYINILRQVEENEDIQMECLDYLHPREVERFIQWNSTDVDFSENENFVAGFERYVAACPGSVAIRFDEQVVTYEQLNNAANYIANTLTAGGTKSGDLVGVGCGRCPELVAALLGILKAGAAYVPLDPSYPDARLDYIAEKSKVRVILTQGQHQAKFPGKSIFGIDDLWVRTGAFRVPNPGVPINSYSPAYVIFTSGTTGAPKGVVVTHASLANYLLWAGKSYRIESGIGAIVHSSISFDLTVTSLLLPLMNGQTVHLVPETSGVQGLIDLIAAGHDYTLVKLTPSHLEILVQTLTGDQIKGAIRTMVLGGEALSRESVRKWKESSPETLIINEYGPTEATVGCCVAVIDEEELALEGPVSIGFPISNTKLFVLDERRKLAPSGAPGDLYIGGKCLSSGYLDDDELTKGSFRTLDLGQVGRTTLYKTGDKARYRPNGALEYLGRSDAQIKLHGYRIEPGEIESRIRKQDNVNNALVRLIEVGQGKEKAKALAAYVVWRDPQQGDLRRLEHEVSRFLPGYMLPQYWNAIKAIPINENGKVAVDKLPSFEFKRTLVKPRSDKEAILCGIWREVLRLDEVGIEDNYFELGGDSIRCIPIISKAKNQGINFSLDELFTYPTIKALIENINVSLVDEVAAELLPFCMVENQDRQKMPEEIEDAYPLTVLQQGMIFHNKLEEGKGLYHDIFSYRLNIPVYDDFDWSLLRESVDELTARHPALRTTFEIASYRKPLQLVHRKGVDCLGITDLSGEEPAIQDAQIQKWLDIEKARGFDLGSLPLVRFHVHVLRKDTAQFSMSFHHAVIDGWSDGVILKEIFGSTLARINKVWKPSKALATTFRDYVYLEQKVLEDSKFRNFWQDKLKGMRPLRLTRLNSQQSIRESERNHLQVLPMDGTIEEALKTLAAQNELPIKSLLLAVHMRALSIISGDDDVTTCLVSAGRPTTEDGDKVLGLFINSTPFRIRFGEMMDGSWKDLVLRVFQEERAIIAYRRYPYGKMHDFVSGGLLSESLFYFTDYHNLDEIFDETGLKLAEVKAHELTSFPLVSHFNIEQLSRSITGQLCCVSEHFSSEQCQQYAGIYRSIMEDMVSNFSAGFNGMSRILSQQNDRCEYGAAIHYCDYLCWSKSLLARNAQADHEAYWQRRLQGHVPGAIQQLENEPGQSFREQVHASSLGREDLENIARFCAVNSLDARILFKYVLALTLSRYGGGHDVVLLASADSMAGSSRGRQEELFHNYIPERFELDNAQSSLHLLKQYQIDLEDDLKHGSMHADLIAEALGQSHEQGLYSVSRFVFDYRWPGSQREQLEIKYQIGQYDRYSRNYLLKLTVIEDIHAGTSERRKSGECILEWRFNADLLTPRQIESLASSFRNLLEQVLDEPTSNPACYDPLSEHDRWHIFRQWNNTYSNFPAELCAHELFEQQVARSPSHPALRFEGGVVSYRELNEFANRLANFLINSGIAPEDLVGLCLERSVEMVAAIIAVWKAGAAYVPLDPDYPAGRIEYMVGDSSLKIVLTQAHLGHLLEFGNCRVEKIDDPGFRKALDEYGSENNPPESLNLSSSNLAYVFYTSGSTGLPKGVCTEHSALVNRLCWMMKNYELCADDKVLQKTPYSFDVSIWEIVWPLITGAQLHIAIPHGHKDPLYLLRTIKMNEITVLHFVPSMLNVMLDAVDFSECKSVKHVFCTGEALTKNHLRKFFSATHKSALTNLYGPTEAAIEVSSWDCVREREGSVVPIGKPIDNTKLYVLDSFLQACPVEVIGELYIGGVGLARGYLNRPELTQARFVEVCFADGVAERLYKTGDLARWLPDGNIDFLGRNDHQIKLHGQRIELGEIEYHISRVEEVRGAAVTLSTTENGDKRLVAYIAVHSGPGQERDVTNIREKLKRRIQEALAKELPDYMVPGIYEFLDELPVTTNGKVDRNALPEPRQDDKKRGEVIEPQNAVEHTLLAIWKRVLEREIISTHDDFFAIGGNSLSVMVLQALIYSEFNLQVGMKGLFLNSTITSLAEFLLQEKKKANAVDHKELCFMFPAAEELRPGMAGMLYESATAYQEAFDRCAEILHKHSKIALRDIVYGGSSDPRYSELLNSPVVSEVALFATCYSLVAWLRDCGLTPGSMIGQGTGEYVAACVAGVISVEDGIRLSLARGEVFAGLHAAKADSRAKDLKIGLKQEFVRKVNFVKHSQGVIPYVSSVTGDWIDAAHLDSTYWGVQLFDGGFFASGMSRLFRSEARQFLEVGPGRSLSRMIKMHASSEGREIYSLFAGSRDLKDELDALNASLEALGLPERLVPKSWWRVLEQTKSTLTPVS